MSTTAPPIAPTPGGLRSRVSAFLYRRRAVKLLLLLAPPLGWIVVVYLAALAVLLFTSLWIEDELSGRIIHTLRATTPTPLAAALIFAQRSIAARIFPASITACPPPSV